MDDNYKEFQRIMAEIKYKIRIHESADNSSSENLDELFGILGNLL